MPPKISGASSSADALISQQLQDSENSLVPEAPSASHTRVPSGAAGPSSLRQLPLDCSDASALSSIPSVSLDTLVRAAHMSAQYRLPNVLWGEVGVYLSPLDLMALEAVEKSAHSGAHTQVQSLELEIREAIQMLSRHETSIVSSLDQRNHLPKLKSLTVSNVTAETLSPLIKLLSIRLMRQPNAPELDLTLRGPFEIGEAFIPLSSGETWDKLCELRLSKLTFDLIPLGVFAPGDLARMRAPVSVRLPSRGATQSIAAAIRMPTLTSLEAITDNFVEADGVITTIANHASLREIRFIPGYDQLSNQQILTLATSQSISHFTLPSYWGLPANVANHFAQSNTLRSLTLPSYISCDAALKLSESTTLSTLKCWDIRRGAGGDTRRALHAIINMPGLRSLSYGSSRPITLFDVSDMQVIANKAWESLELNIREVSSEAMVILANTTAERLTVQWRSHISSDVIDAFCSNRMIKHLKLDLWDVPPGGLITLARHPTLLSLHLCAPCFSFAGARFDNGDTDADVRAAWQSMGRASGTLRLQDSLWL